MHRFSVCFTLKAMYLSKSYLTKSHFAICDFMGLTYCGIGRHVHHHYLSIQKRSEIWPIRCYQGSKTKKIKLYIDTGNMLTFDCLRDCRHWLGRHHNKIILGYSFKKASSWRCWSKGELARVLCRNFCAMEDPVKSIKTI
jgi:hypothetical protein